MKTIITKCGVEVQVDDEDYELVSAYKWSLNGGRYPKTHEYDKERKRSISFSMHRLLMGRHRIRDGLVVDHVDGNPLNNRRSNLRVCTYSQNNSNRGKSPNNSSGYKGVTFHKQMKKWQAQIMVNEKCIHLGLFTDPESAHEAYKKAALEYQGEFANFGRTPEIDNVE
ncbi:HNH endonuclease [Burkholderia cepacia]|uniref:HNH endonuclease n=1 Tax=Burkholderia cepacia TaxID=292 RepID=UPI000AF79837|nr:HNH endonuclease [Burkholderia cepacia]